MMALRVNVQGLVCLAFIPFGAIRSVTDSSRLSKLRSEVSSYHNISTYLSVAHIRDLLSFCLDLYCFSAGRKSLVESSFCLIKINASYICFCQKQ